jgi:phage shock protein E
MTTYVLLVAAVLLAVFAFGRSSGTVPGAAAREAVAGGALLLDVRSEGEFASGHLEGAVNIPVQVLAERIGDVGDPARPVVVYCRSGLRSRRAKAILEQHDFVNVLNLGGMSRW